MLNWSNNTFKFKSLGQKKYYSLLNHVDLVLGNSSSGLLEMPYFKKGTINIGERQKGRTKAKSIIDCKPEKKHIMQAIETLYSLDFQNKLKEVKSPYGEGGASKRIVKQIEEINTHFKCVVISKFP